MNKMIKNQQICSWSDNRPKPPLAQLLRPPIPRARGRRRIADTPNAPSLTSGPHDPIGSGRGAVAQLGER